MIKRREPYMKVCACGCELTFTTRKVHQKYRANCKRGVVLKTKRENEREKRRIEKQSIASVNKLSGVVTPPLSMQQLSPSKFARAVNVFIRET